jgi:hypothetical protein
MLLVVRHFLWKLGLNSPKTRVLFPVANGFKLEFSSDPPFQHSAPSNASMDASQLTLCSAEVEALTEKGAIVEVGGEDGCISRYFLIPKKGVNRW